MDSTAFTELSTLASPLDHVFRHVPKAHEKALRQAVYNIIAAATFGGICFAAYYVLVVLEPFIMPMFWAVMTGFVIHPYKTQFADILRSQLQWYINRIRQCLFCFILIKLSIGSFIQQTFLFLGWETPRHQHR